MRRGDEDGFTAIREAYIKVLIEQPVNREGHHVSGLVFPPISKQSTSSQRAQCQKPRCKLKRVCLTWRWCLAVFVSILRIYPSESRAPADDQVWICKCNRLASLILRQANDCNVVWQENQSPESSCVLYLAMDVGPDNDYLIKVQIFCFWGSDH